MQQNVIVKKDEELFTESQAMSASGTLPYVHSPRESMVTNSEILTTDKKKTTEDEAAQKETEHQYFVQHQSDKPHHEHCQQEYQRHQQEKKEINDALPLPILPDTQFSHSQPQSEMAILSAINSSASMFASALSDKDVNSEQNSFKSHSQTNAENSICNVFYNNNNNKNKDSVYTAINESNITNKITNTNTSEESKKVNLMHKEQSKVHYTPLNNLLDHNVYTEEEVLLELEALRKRALLTSTPFNKHILPILTWYVLRDKFGEAAAVKYVPFMNVDPMKSGNDALPSSFLPQINEIRRSKRASHDAFNANPHHYYNITPPRSSLLTEKFTEDTSSDQKDTNHNKNSTTANNETEADNDNNENVQTENIHNETNKLSLYNTEGNLHNITNAVDSTGTITSTTTINTSNSSGNNNVITNKNSNVSDNISNRNNSDVSKQTKSSSLPSSKLSNPRRICSFDLLASQSEMPIEPTSTAEVMTRVLRAETSRLYSNNNNNNTNNNIQNNYNVITGHTNDSNHNSSHTSSNSTYSSLLTSASMPKFVLPQTAQREYDKLSRYTAFRKSMDVAEEKMEMESVVDVKLVAEPILQTQNTFRIVPRSQIWTPSTPTNSDGSNNTFIVNNNNNTNNSNNINTNSSCGSVNSKLSNRSTDSNNSNNSNNSNFVVYDGLNTNKIYKKSIQVNDNVKPSNAEEKHFDSIITNTKQMSKTTIDNFKEGLEKVNAEVSGSTENVNNNNKNVNTKLYNFFTSFPNSYNSSLNGVEEEQQQQKQQQIQHELWQHKESSSESNVLVVYTQRTPSRFTSCTPDLENYLSEKSYQMQNNIDFSQPSPKLAPETTRKQNVTSTTEQISKNDKSSTTNNTFITNCEQLLQGLTETETSSTLSSFLTSAHAHECAKAPSLAVQENIVSTEEQHIDDNANSAHNEINTNYQHTYKCADTPLYCNNSNINNDDEHSNKTITQIDHVKQNEQEQVKMEEEKEKQVCKDEDGKYMSTEPYISDDKSTKQTTDALTAPVVATDNITNSKGSTIHRCNDDIVDVDLENNMKANDKCNYFNNNGEEDKKKVNECKSNVSAIKMWEMPEYICVPELPSYDLVLLPHEHKGSSSINTCHTLRCSSPSLHSNSSSSSVESVNVPNMISVAAITATAETTTRTTAVTNDSTNASESINSSIVSSSLEPSCNYLTQSDNSLLLSGHTTLSSSTANMNSSLLLNHSGSTKAPHVDMEEDSNESSSATTMHEQIIDMINSSIKTMHLTHNVDNTNTNKHNNNNKLTNWCNNDKLSENNGNLCKNDDSNGINNNLHVLTPLMEKIQTVDNTIDVKVDHDLKGDKGIYNIHNNNITNAISKSDNDNNSTESKENVNSNGDKAKRDESVANNAYKTQRDEMCNNQIDKNQKDKTVHSLCNREEKREPQSRVVFNSELQLLPSPELSSKIDSSFLLRHQSEQDVANKPNTQAKSIISSKSNNSETSVSSSVFDINRFETALERLLTEEQHIITTDEQLTSEECIEPQVNKKNYTVAKSCKSSNSKNKVTNNINAEESNNINKLTSTSTSSAPVSLIKDKLTAALSHNGITVKNNNSTSNESNGNAKIDQNTSYKITSSVKQNGKNDNCSVSNGYKQKECKQPIGTANNNEKKIDNSVPKTNNCSAPTQKCSGVPDCKTIAKVGNEWENSHENENNQVTNTIYASPRPARRFHALGANSAKKKNKKKSEKKISTTTLTTTTEKKRSSHNNDNENLTSQSSYSSLLSSLTHQPSTPPTLPTFTSSSSSSSERLFHTNADTNPNTNTRRTTPSPTSRPPLHPYSNPRPPSSNVSTGRFARSYNAETPRPATASAKTSSNSFVPHHHSVSVVDISNVPYVPSPNDSTDADHEMVQHTVNERVKVAQQWAERGRAWRLHEELAEINDMELFSLSEA